MDVKAYLMGVFDGEGCVGTGKNSTGRWFLQCSVSMACEPIIHLFVETWGGGWYRRSKPTVGGLILYTWAINSSKALPFLEYATEHSLAKQQACRIGLELATNMAKYVAPGFRKGINLHGGARMISDEDQARRTALVMELRSLQGARSRFKAAS